MEILSADDIVAHTDEKDYSKKQFIYVGVIEQTMKEIIEDEVERCKTFNKNE